MRPRHISGSVCFSLKLLEIMNAEWRLGRAKIIIGLTIFQGLLSSITSENNKPMQTKYKIAQNRKIVILLIAVM